MSCWAALKDYVETGQLAMGRMAVEKAPFMVGVCAEEKATWLKEACASLGEFLKKLPANRRMRKRLQRSSTWLVRWDPEELERKQDVTGGLDGRYDAVVLNAN